MMGLSKLFYINLVGPWRDTMAHTITTFYVLEKWTSQFAHASIYSFAQQDICSKHQRLAFPLDSYGINKTRIPAAMNNAPLTYTGAAV